MQRLLTAVVAVGVGAAVPLLLAARQDADDPSAFRIELAEFQELRAGGGAYLIDVRNPQAYLEGHIEGAVSVPFDTIDSKVKELELVELPIVTYCRCYEEASSMAAAQRLGRYGIEGARALVGGYDAWVAAGGGVATGAAEPAPGEGEAEDAAKPGAPSPDPGS